MIRRRLWAFLLCGCLRIAPFDAIQNGGSYVGISLLNTTEGHSAELFRIASPVDLGTVSRQVRCILSGTLVTLTSPLVLHLVGAVSSDLYIQLRPSQLAPLLTTLQTAPELRDNLIRIYGGIEATQLHDVYTGGACCHVLPPFTHCSPCADAASVRAQFILGLP